MHKILASAACAVAMAFAAAPVLAAPEEVTYLLPAPPNTPAFAPWMIAQQKGYYAEENLKVNFVAAKGGVDVAKQIGAGNAVIGGAIGDTPIIVRANGVPVKAIAVLGAGSLTMVGVHQGGGIKSLADLKGKTITVMSYTDTTYYALLGNMKHVDLGKSDAAIQAAGPPGVWPVFAAGKAQALAGVPDWIVSATDAGANVLLVPALKVPGKLTVAGEKVDLSAIDAPAFVYASCEDHIVPWTSAYSSLSILNPKKPKANRFVLGASGHIAGVINPASKKKRHYWINDGATPKTAKAKRPDAEEWFSGASEHPGSWRRRVVQRRQR
eukprot:gene25609-28937_t